MSNEPNSNATIPEFASPACFMHEVDPGYMGLSASNDRPTDTAKWRAAERQRLIAERLALSQDERQSASGLIAKGLDQLVPDVSGKAISLYWPFRGEPDLREWMADVTPRGGTCLLPLVAGKGQPLVFRAWKAGDKLERGVWNIPYPAEGPEIIPDIVIAPLVGFDPAFYRLGYGGGYYDRTLAAHPGTPLVIGVGYQQQAIATIHPQAHDIPMQAIVTEREIRTGASPSG